MDIIKNITEAGVIAAVSSAENALKMAEAGVGAFVCDTADLAKQIKAALPTLTVGCRENAEGIDFYIGTVHCPKCVERARSTGAALVAVAKNAQEAEKMHSLGADVIAFVDADANGGVAMLGAMSVAAADAKFIVEGAADGLSYTAVGACIGWTDTEMDTAEDISGVCSERMYASLGLTLAHVGINAQNENEAIEISTAYSKLLGLKQKTGNSSCFAGSWVEVMKTPYLGERGHIAIGTKSLPRAIAFFTRCKVKFNMSTAKPVAIYFEDDIGGFAIHLVQK